MTTFGCWYVAVGVMTTSGVALCSGCDRPWVIEVLRGKEVVDVAAGGAHSACVTAAGELYTWGKGRYGRLGHGDSEAGWGTATARTRHAPNW